MKFNQFNQPVRTLPVALPVVAVRPVLFRVVPLDAPQQLVLATSLEDAVWKGLNKAGLLVGLDRQARKAAIDSCGASIVTMDHMIPTSVSLAA